VKTRTELGWYLFGLAAGGVAFVFAFVAVQALTRWGGIREAERP